MDRKNGRETSPTNVFKRTVLIIFVCLMFMAVGWYFMYTQTLYKPLLLLVYIQVLPVAVNIILYLPRKSDKDFGEEKGQSEENTVKAEEKAEKTEDGEEIKSESHSKKKKKKSKGGFAKRIRKARNAYYKIRHIILAVAIMSVTLYININYWTVQKQSVSETFSLPSFIPVLLICGWVVMFVIRNYCKHLEKNESEDSKEGCKYDRALLNSLRGAVALVSVYLALMIVDTGLSVLNIVNIEKYVIIILNVLFLYETVFIIISVLVRLIRKEMNSAPEINIPVLSVGKGDLNVVSYLEANTGMTMRSLWSIRLIKEILPFCVVLIIGLLWMFSGVVKIDSHQQASHYRLGKLQEEIMEPGIHLTLPWPFDEVVVYDTETVEKMTIGYVSGESGDNFWTSGHGGEEYKLLLGGGKELVSINLRLEYKISDLKSYVTVSSAPESLMEAAAYEIITDRAIRTDLETLLSYDRQALSKEIKEELSQRLEESNTGLEVVSVVLESIHPPVEIAEVYQQIISAEITAEKIILEAQGRAKTTVIAANTDKLLTVNGEMAKQYAAVSDAKSSVADFMAAKEADDAFGEKYRYQKYLDALTKAYSKGQLVIVGEGIDQKNIYIGGMVIE